MKKIIFIFLLININLVLADTFIDVCKRGPIGLKIKQMTSAKSCKEVSKEKMASITRLSLEYEEISSIPDYAFMDLSSVKEIDLSSNYIRNITPHAFQGLPSLEQLNLFDNYISSIDKNVFSDLTSLKTLNLGNNYLFEISRSNLGLSENVVIDGVWVNP